MFEEAESETWRSLEEKKAMDDAAIIEATRAADLFISTDISDYYPFKTMFRRLKRLEEVDWNEMGRNPTALVESQPSLSFSALSLSASALLCVALHNSSFLSLL